LETKPEWIKKSINPSNANLKSVIDILNDNYLNTVCQSANCPNIFECFAKKSATFMIMGNICTRNCSFCAVNAGRPVLPDAGYKVQEIIEASLISDREKRWVDIPL